MIPGRRVRILSEGGRPAVVAGIHLDHHGVAWVMVRPAGRRPAVGYLPVELELELDAA